MLSLPLPSEGTQVSALTALVQGIMFIIHSQLLAATQGVHSRTIRKTESVCLYVESQHIHVNIWSHFLSVYSLWHPGDKLPYPLLPAPWIMETFHMRRLVKLDHQLWARGSSAGSRVGPGASEGLRRGSRVGGRVKQDGEGRALPDHICRPVTSQTGLNIIEILLWLIRGGGCGVFRSSYIHTP